MKKVKVNEMGMELERWMHKSCIADVAVGNDWATIYTVESKKQGKGHATELLREIKNYYESKNKRFAGTVALSAGMKAIYKKLKIKEYE